VRDARARVEDSLSRMSMLDRSDAPVRSLSRGMQQRVSIARAMVHSPQLVLADEPYSGLDESGARALTVLLGELRSAGTAIILVTHNLAEGLSLATLAAVMQRGRFVRYDWAVRVEAGSYLTLYRVSVGRGLLAVRLLVDRARSLGHRVPFLPCVLLGRHLR